MKVSLHSLLLLLTLSSLSLAREVLVDLRDYNILDGTIINLNVGDNLRVLLTENPTSGYNWYYIVYTGDATSNLGKATYHKNDFI